MGWDESADYGSPSYKWYHWLGVIVLGIVICGGIAYCSLQAP